MGEEALAIGLYAALVGGSFTETLAIAANHDGDFELDGVDRRATLRRLERCSRNSACLVRRLDVIEPIYEITDGLLSMNTGRL